MGFEAVPQELKDMPQWAVWRLVPVPEDKIGKPGKLPLQVQNTSGTHQDGNYPKASSTDPTTWTTFEKAQAASMQLLFALTADDPYCVIDLDNMRYDSGEAQKILTHFPGAYVEESPSSTGIHIWITCTPRKKRQIRLKDGSGIDILSQKHFCTVTGKRRIGSDHIPDGEAGVAWLLATYGGEQARKPLVLDSDPITADDINVEVNYHAESPYNKLEYLMNTDTYFAAIWNKTRQPHKDGTDSGYEMSIASQLMHKGWTHQEICDTLVWWRRQKNLEQKHAGAIRSTIAKAANTVQKKTAKERLEECPTDKPPEILAVLRHLTKMPIVRYVQVGQDPSFYRLYIEGQDEGIPIGNANQVIQLSTWQKIVLDHTGELLDLDRTAFKQFLARLHAIAIKEEPHTYANVKAFTDMLIRYARNASSSLDYDTVAEEGHCFDEGYFWFVPATLKIWARMARENVLPDSELLSYVRDIGGEPVRKTRRDGRGRNVTKRYWRIPQRIIRPPMPSEGEAEGELEITAEIDPEPEIMAEIDTP